jgi:hypothetical protein
MPAFAAIDALAAPSPPISAPGSNGATFPAWGGAFSAQINNANVFARRDIVGSSLGTLRARTRGAAAATSGIADELDGTLLFCLVHNSIDPR